MHNHSRSAVFVGLLLAAVVVVPVAVAQQNPEEQAQKVMEKMEAAKERLGLTDEQATQVREILEDNARKAEEVFKKHGVEPGNPPKNMRAKMALGRDLKPIRAQGDERLKEVLTDEQMKEFEQMRKQAQEEMKKAREERK